jgi:hypothetical protein
MSTGFYTVRRGDTLTKIAKQHGTTPEEMAKLNHLTGKPKMHLRREVTDEWDPNSANECSSARGVSQVLDGTWIELAMSKGTFLNTRTREEGWITTAEVNERAGHHNASKVVPAFKLSDGKFVTKAPLCRTLSARPYLVGRCKASDQNLQELLDLRFDVECAVHTAVDYGKANMRDLSNQGYKLEKLNDGEKAKIMYLCHHLGSSDARKFIEDTMSDDHAQRLLERQIGKVATDIRVDNCGGDYVKAHREWLSEFVDRKIRITKHMCDESVAEEVLDLLPLTKSIRRKKG